MDVATLPTTEEGWLQFICTLLPVENANHCRDVYYLDDEYVLKLGTEYEGTSSQNILEAQRWVAYRDTELGQYLAPVEAASPDGSWLIMRRVVPLTRREKVPYRLRMLLDAHGGFTDIRPDNCGKLADGTIVLLDYGM